MGKMIRLGKLVRRGGPEVLAAAEKYFGGDGVGLKVVERSATTLQLSGGGGSITVTVSAAGKRTDVDLVAVEWDQQARTFLAKLR